jgi:hypothetical protein
MKSQWIVRFSISTLCALALACGNDDGNGGGNNKSMDAGESCNVEANFTSLYDNVFNTITCNSAGCHGVPENGGLLFSDSKENAYAALMADSAMFGAVDAKRVVAGDINNSLFWTRLNALKGTTIMPPSGKLADACELAMIKTWIENGAAND